MATQESGASKATVSNGEVKRTTLWLSCGLFTARGRAQFRLFERLVRGGSHLNVLPIVTRAPVTLSVPAGFETTPLLPLTMFGEIPTVSGGTERR